MYWQRQELVADWFYNNYVVAKQYDRCTIDDYEHCIKVATRMLNYQNLTERQRSDVSGMMSEIFFYGLAQSFFNTDPIGTIIRPLISSNQRDQNDKVDIEFADYFGEFPLGVDVKCKHGQTSRMTNEKSPRIVIQLSGNEVSHTDDMVWMVINQPELKPIELADAMRPTHLKTGLYGIISNQIERIKDFNQDSLRQMPLTEEVLNCIAEF